MVGRQIPRALQAYFVSAMFIYSVPFLVHSYVRAVGWRPAKFSMYIVKKWSICVGIWKGQSCDLYCICIYHVAFLLRASLPIHYKS